MSVETTFIQDINQENLLQLELQDLFQEMSSRLESHLEEDKNKKIKKIFVKVKFNDFSKTTCEETLRTSTDGPLEKSLTPESFAPLLSHCLKKKNRAVRLIGLGVRFITQEEYSPLQLSLIPYCS